MDYFRLPVSLADVAVRALEVDSQRNSEYAKSVIGSFEEPKLTPKTKKELNILLDRLQMPLIGDAGILEGTLTCR